MTDRLIDPGLPTAVAWYKSSYSANNNDCVEIAVSDVIGIRDSKAPDGPILTVPAGAFRAFALAVREGRRSL